MSEINLYDKPIQPGSSWELLKWLVLEPSRVNIYTETVESRYEQFFIFLKLYSWVSLIVMTTWFGFLCILAFTDLPIHFTSFFDRSVIEIWDTHYTFTTRLIELIIETYAGLAFGLALGLAFGLASGLTGGLAEGLASGLTGGLALGLALGLAFGLAEGLAVGLAFGLPFGLAFGLAEGLALGLAEGLAFGLAGGLVVGLVGGLVGGLAVGLAVGLMYYFTFFRLFLLPSRYWQGLRSNFFSTSPYLKDELIWLPLFNHDKNLVKWAQEQPWEGQRFTNFILRHRRLQRKLAYKIWHASIAGNLRNSFVDKLHKIEHPSVYLSDKKKLKPTPDWVNTLEDLQKAHIHYEQQTNSNLQYTAFQDYIKALEAFEQQNLSADPGWNHIYFDALKHLKVQAQSKLEQLRQQVAPIAFNPYQIGNALEPGRDNAVFLDREDLRNELEYVIRNSKNMPLFLIRGQRRVGKTSLLKFLPQILGKGFEVVFLDLQGSDYCPDIPGWLEAIRREVNRTAGLVEETPWEAGDNWLTAWGELSAYLTEVAKSCDTIILLCFDEYEALQERGFAEEPEKAAKLLAAMRSYSQHQQQVVFLFSGALYFDEISTPDWAKFFVNSKPMEVKYLSKEKAHQLITRPYEDFPIRYEQGLPERIYELTQGHPALTQEICSYLVDTANQGSRHEVYMTDLEQIIEEKIVVAQNHPLNRFWNEFCHTEAQKETVRQLIKRETFTDIPALRSLMRHNFILKKEDSYQLCAPLFEMYVRAVDDTFFEV